MVATIRTFVFKMKLDMNLSIAEAGSAADWVQGNRAKEISNKEKAKQDAIRKQKMLLDEEEELMEQSRLNSYSSRDLKGMKVMHGADDFEHGKSVILTLADSDVLNYNEHGKLQGLNEEETDVLENVNLAESDRRLQREKQKKRNAQPVYSGLDDAEFGEEVIPGTRPAILSQYDKEKKRAARMQLGDDGEVTIDRSNSNMKSSGGGAAAGKVRSDFDSLKMEPKNVSDFYTKTEYATFHKKKKSDKDKKKRKIRKKSADDDDDGDGGSGNGDEPVNLDDLLGGGEMETDMQQHITVGTASNGSNSDHMFKSKEGSSALSEVAAMALEEVKRKENYELAKKKAESKSIILDEPNSSAADGSSNVGMGDDSKPKRKVVVATKDNTASNYSLKKVQEFRSIDLDEVDPDMSAALARARRMALQQQAQATMKAAAEAKAKEQAALAATTGSGIMEEESGASFCSSAAADITKSNVNYADRGAVLAQQMSARRVAALESVESKDNKDDLDKEIAGGTKSFNKLLYDGPDSDEILDIDAEGRRADGTLIFNSTTEFTNRLQARMSEQARARAELAFQEKSRLTSAADTDNLGSNGKGITANSSSNSMKRARGGHEEEDDDDDGALDSDRRSKKLAVSVEDANGDNHDEDENDIYGEGVMERSDDDDDDDDTASKEKKGNRKEEDEDLDFVHRQPLVSSGMAATLALLKGTGELRAKEKLAGRAKDSRALDPSQRDHGIVLEYRDDNGRKLTQKEAFRQLNYNFHGFGAGKKKTEKRLKVREEVLLFFYQCSSLFY